MARPRAATDKQILAAADELAAEKGWKAVYAKEVREKLGLGGSLSTFTQIINTWRAERAESEDVEAPTAEIVEDRASVIDDGLSAVADALKTMRTTVTAEIDRAVADERKKSDRMRADEREVHEKTTAALRAEIEALQSENADLAEEAGFEATRADTAEDATTAASEEIDRLKQKITQLEETAAQVPELQQQIKDLYKAADDLKASTDAMIASAEAREESAQDARTVAEQKTEDLRIELKDVNSALSTVRTDLATAQAEKTRLSESVKEQMTRADLAEARVAPAQERADAAWGRVDELIAQMARKDEKDYKAKKA